MSRDGLRPDAGTVCPPSPSPSTAHGVTGNAQFLHPCSNAQHGSSQHEPWDGLSSSDQEAHATDPGKTSQAHDKMLLPAPSQGTPANAHPECIEGADAVLGEGDQVTQDTVQELDKPGDQRGAA